MLTVRAPATSANLGSGFDVFGIALDRPADVVRVEKTEETTVTVTGSGSQYIPEDPANNVVGAVADALDVTARIEIDKGIRPSSGLGSSAASAAGAALALSELYDLGRSREDLIAAAAEGEALVSGTAHEDNVAPALLGGFTIATDDGVTSLDASIPFVVTLPDLSISTRDARKVVPDDVRMTDLVETVGNASRLTVGMCRGDPELVGAGMDDPVVTPARADLVEGYDRVAVAAREAGATGVTVSGAGPAMVAACHSDDRREVAARMVAAFDAAGVDAHAYQTAIGRGASVFQ